MSDKPYENRLSLDQLRVEVREMWDKVHALESDIQDLPEVPSYSTMLLLSRGGYPTFWEIGKRYQRELPSGAIPWKCEAEIGAGRWKVIREALLAAQVGTHPQGGDAKQAPGDSLSDAVHEVDAPCSLRNPPIPTTKTAEDHSEEQR